LVSASGLTFAIYFFLAMSLAIAVMIYALLTSAALRRSEFSRWTMRKPLAAAFAALMFVVVFGGIDLSSFAGFQRVTITETGLRLHYVVLNASAELGSAEIGDVIRRPAFKTRWRLEIYTTTGNKYESAPGSYADVKAAWEAILKQFPR
jgi:heme A synthase